MYNLITANVSRLLQTVAFWISIFIMIIIQGLFYIIILKNGKMPMDIILFFSIQVIGILFATFFSLFLGTEYSDGTIRNKLVVGHNRVSIYLSNLISGIIAISFIYMTDLITGTILGLILHEEPHNNMNQIIVIVIIVWIACISFVSIFNFIGMLSTNKATSIILCIFISLLLMVSAFIIFNLLSKPNYLIGIERKIYQIVFEINPSGQLLHASSLNLTDPWIFVLYSFLLIIIFTGTGIVVFNKKDLK